MNSNTQKGFFAVMAREIRRIQSRPVYLMFSVTFPLISMLFLVSVFSQGVPREFPVAVFDADNSALSRQIVRMIDSTPSVKVVERVTDFTEGRKLIERRNVYSFVVIPKNTEKDVLRGASPSIIGYYNNIYLLPATLSYRSIYSVVKTVSTGIKIQIRMKKGEMEKSAFEKSMPIRIDVHKLFNPYLNYQYFLAGGFMPAMFQIFVVVCSIFALGYELKRGTAGDWINTAGGSVFKALSGKLFPYLIIFFIMGFFMNSLLINFVKIPLKGSFFLITVSNVLFILAAMAVAIVIVAVFANLRFALSIGSGYTAIAFTFSGLTFPETSMPLLLRYLGEGIPLTHHLRIFISQAFRGAPYFTTYESFAALALFLVLPLFAHHRWSVIINSEKYWGKI